MIKVVCEKNLGQREKVMDHTKWTLSKRFTAIAFILFTLGAIISHFHKNHTHVVVAEKKGIVVIQPTPPPHTPTPLTKTVAFKTATIYHSLAAAEKNAGLTKKMDVQLNKMFANQNIAHDIHPGDRLEVLYHEYFIGDQKDHPGHIIAAKIVGKKDDVSVIRFDAPNHHVGYYKANGQGIMPAFLRVPVHYVRIGSYFTYHRLDPILHEVRPHLGVDFDAPEGTPVKAIGDGIVVFCKQMRGYGNVLMIQYNRTYKTLYAHLEKFARPIKPHEYVRKGEVVGYVGETGWATGPHLHFAVYKNGVPVNPLTVKFPSSASVPERYRHAFFDKEDQWFNEMKLFEQARMAKK
ncbi:MAG: peptidoglycan-specific endopeptidase, M23 family [uncultured bacterium]|nr:MAG: peptidoglycan-specific endopeptidase, M23 family [uncultured bacterium]